VGDGSVRAAGRALFRKGEDRKGAKLLEESEIHFTG